MRNLRLAVMIAALAPLGALAEPAKLAPATEEDLQAFDRAIEAQSPTLTAPAGAPMRAVRDAVVGEARKAQHDRPKEAHKRTPPKSGDPTAKKNREAIAGKRSGKSDNPGKGDSGKPVEGKGKKGHGGG